MTHRRSFPPDPSEVAAARRFVVEVLTAAGLDPWPAELVVSELATNAARHSGTAYTVSVFVDDAVRVEVWDRSDALPAVRGPSRRRQRGRGLVLVDRLARSWGVAAAPEGKTVWCVLPLAEPELAEPVLAREWQLAMTTATA